MKKFNKLSRNTRPQEQPEGTYGHGKNGVQDYVQGAIINEPGFLPSSAVIPYQPIGLIETDKFPIIFSSDNTNSAIGYFDVENDVYTPCLDDATLPFKLPFDTSYYITGQAQRNYKGEMVCAFTDKQAVPFYVNLDVPNANTLNDIKLFPNALPADISVKVESGGILSPGAYYVALKYTKTDGTESGFVAVSAPVTISGAVGTATDKALEITLTNIDTDYDNVQIAIVSKVNGIMSAVQYLNPIRASNDATIVYSGTELTETITLEEILTPRKVYTKVGSMGQLNDSLYIVDLETAPRIKMQKWANLVKLQWHSKLISVDPVYEPMTTGKEKSHMHGEVYAFYLRYKLKDGTTTNSFPIPGEALTIGDIASSTPATAEGLVAFKYQVEDTIPSFDLGTKSGSFGKWENSSETYPDTADFDSTSVGGENLRGEKVRHFRFPSIQWCKTNLYAGEPNYGRNSLDMLGVSVENVIIPAEYADQIIGWEVFYAKRNVANSTIIGQSLLLYGGRNRLETALSPSNYYSSGGNWHSFIDFKTGTNQPIYLDQSIYHFHSFDMLLNRPAVSPDYMSLQLRHKRNDLAGTGAYIEDQAVNGENNGPITLNLDYLQYGISPTVPAKTIKAVRDSLYVPNNIDLGGKWHNLLIEGFFGGKFKNPEALISAGDITGVDVQPGSRKTYTPKEKIPKAEHTFLANLMSLKQQLFVPFVSQSLVREGSSNTVANATIFFGGDVYISDYTFHTYGNWTHNGTPGFDLDPFQGTKVARRFVCETAANLYERYEDLTNIYSRYYPKSSMVAQDTQNYLTNFMRTSDPNQFGYRKDSNALDDLFSADIYNTFAEDLTVHPYRIHRGGKLSRQTKMRSWRTFLPLDYYELQKNMGKPVHIEGMDDRLLIHCENALFLTQDKTKLESDIISVTLGSGDIFQFQPQEAMSSKLGYAGTQHDLACIRTPFGYAFIDNKEGQIYLYKGELKLLNEDMNTFFREYLKMKEKNPFIGNGYTLGYDPQYKRLLLTMRDKQVTDLSGTLPVYDQANILTYTAGDLLLKDGRVVEFLGVNDSIYACTPTLVPTANNLTITIPEDTAIGTIVGTLTGTNISEYYIAGSSFPFYVNATTGEVKLIGPLNYYVTSLYSFGGQGYTVEGAADVFTLTINITEVNRAPILLNAEVTIDDTALDSSLVIDLLATDREGDTITYSIISGNTGGAFAIDTATGEVTVDDATQLDGTSMPVYNLVIGVTDGAKSSTGTLTVFVTHVNKAPVTTNLTITIPDTTPSDTVVVTIPPAVDVEGDALTYTLISQSVPGIFSFDPITREVTLILNSSLNPVIVPQYQLAMSVSDGFHSPVLFTVYINVEYARSSLSFVPAVPSCAGGTPTCPAGYTLSPDNTVCVKETTTAPTIISSGGCLAASPNGAYGSYFARIYKPGFNNTSIGLYVAPTPEVLPIRSLASWVASSGLMSFQFLPCAQPRVSLVWFSALSCSELPLAVTGGVTFSPVA